jgi:3-phosphoshikimate 1-carboxyvinyltransferase
MVTPGGPLTGNVRPPGSKSLTNRALICAAFAEGGSRLSGALVSEDTEVMVESLRACGLEIQIQDGGKSLQVVQGKSIDRDRRHELFIANSGTTVRFLTAALSAAGGRYRLHGVERMHQRPIGDLVRALQDVQQGSIETKSPQQCPPVEIDSRGWCQRKLRVGGNVSSQYLSGLMMASPIALAAREGSQKHDQDQRDAPTQRPTIQIEVVGELVSRPYVEMTAEVMRAFGAGVRVVEVESSHPSPGKDLPAAEVSVRVDIDGGYRATEYVIEPDASAASYFWAAAAITGGKVCVEGLFPDALQGDVGFCQVLEQMGCDFTTDARGMTISGRATRGIDVDMNAISDTVQTLAIVALFAEGPTRVRGVAHNRFKETDRIGDLANELRKLGAVVEEHDDGMTIHPPGQGLRPAVLDTYNDHRMAMSLSLAGLAADGVEIRNPACTIKTYPEFFADLEQLIGRPHRWSNDEV